MPRGSKAKYTAEQKRLAAHIESEYEDKGVPKEEALARAWATVNKQSGGGERAGGSGRTTSESEKASARKESARRGAATRKGLARNSAESRATQTKESLMKEAREKNIPGRSSMRKQALIEALCKAG